MINIKSSQVFLLNSLAVPRLGNVQLRFHFLRRGTSVGVYIINVLDSEGQSYTSKLQR
jgi:hypothetical protein